MRKSGLKFRLAGALAVLVVAAAPALAAGPGVIKFDQSGYSGTEGSTVQVVVERSQGEDGVASVRVVSSGGTALSGSDYTAVDVTLTWAADDGSNRIVSVPILDDATSEGGETFNLRRPGRRRRHRRRQPRCAGTAPVSPRDRSMRMTALTSPSMTWKEDSSNLIRSP